MPSSLLTTNGRDCNLCGERRIIAYAGGLATGEPAHYALCVGCDGPPVGHVVGEACWYRRLVRKS